MDENSPVSIRDFLYACRSTVKWTITHKRKAVLRDVVLEVQAARELAKYTASVYPVDFREAVRSALPGTTACHDVTGVYLRPIITQFECVEIF